MRRFDISLELYRIFCTVAKIGSITRAATELYVSQPSVSMSIKQLEDKLGCSLFIRSVKGVKLTAEGKMLFSYLEQALGLIDTAEQKYMEMVHMQIGEIIIGASDTLSSQFLLPYLEKYNTQHNNINIKVANRTTRETMKVLKSGEIDFGFVNLPIEEDEAIEVHECLLVHDCMIGGTAYKQYSDTGIALADIESYPLLMLERESNTRSYIDRFADAHGITLRPIIELGSSDLLVKFARINLGISFVIREFVRDEIDGITLFEIPLLPPIEPRAVGLVKLKGIPFSFAAEGFVKLLDIDI